MSDTHNHNHDHDHQHAVQNVAPAGAAAVKEPLDPGMKALSEALRWLFAMLKGIMVLVVVLFFLSGLYRIEQSEQAVVLRFGKVKGEGAKAIVAAGLHWAWPKPIEEVIKIPASSVTRQMPVDSFWYYQDEKEKAGLRELAPGQTLQFTRDGYSLTASSGMAAVLGASLGGPEGVETGQSLLTTDYNLVHTRWSIRYWVTDPKKLLENLWDGTPGIPERRTGWYAVEDFLRDVLCDAVIITSANRDINKIVWEGQRQFGSEVEERLKSKLQDLQVGLGASLEFVDRTPPRQVKPMFEAAASARSEAVKVVTAAEAQANEIHGQAQSEATQIVAQAKAYSRMVEESARADESYLREVLDKINKKVESKVAAGEVKADQRQQIYDRLLAETMDQLYHETIRQVMGGAAEMFVLGSPAGVDEELRLWINRDASLGKKQAGEKK